MYRIGRFRLYLALFCVIIAESTLLQALGVGTVRPNLMLVFVIFVALYSDWSEALEAGIVAGLLRGALSTGSVGISLSLFAMCGLITTYCRNKVFKDSFFTQIILALFITLIFNGAMIASWRLVKSVEMINISLRDDALPASFSIGLYTALITPPVFFCLKRLLRVREPEF